MPREEEYRGTTRTLQVLRALNVENGTSITHLSRTTGISRTALYRIIGALQEAGYIRRRKEDGAIFLTSLVQTLSDGFKDEYWISEIAGPVLDDLQKQVVWPTDLGICRNYQMQLASTTRRHSPLVIDRGLTGEHMPLLRTALGLAYFAYCAPPERRAILDYFTARGKTFDEKLAQDRKQLDRITRDVRERGYAFRYRNVMGHTRYSDLVVENATIAVPILVDGRSVASIGITFIASAMTIQQAVSRHLAPLKEAAHQIERELAARMSRDGAAAGPGPEPLLAVR